MSGFDDPTPAIPVVDIRLDLIHKAEGTDGLWWVAEGLAGGSAQPRGILASREDARALALELAAKHGVAIVEHSHVGEAADTV